MLSVAINQYAAYFLFRVDSDSSEIVNIMSNKKEANGNGVNFLLLLKLLKLLVILKMSLFIPCVSQCYKSIKYENLFSGALLS